MANPAFSQDLEQSQVPSIIVNNFEKSFPNAKDTEWEMEDGLYTVDFETDAKKDHEVWFNPSGELVKHKQEIAKEDLPDPVLSKINSEFNGYKIDDVKKIVEGTNITYKIELGTLLEELEITMSAEGEILDKKED
jgi:hypothetical protein